MNKTLTIVGVIVAVVLAGGALIKSSNTSTPVTPAEQPVGAMASPDISSPYFSFGDIRQWARRVTSLNTASTTLCAIQSPSNATSSLMMGAFRMENNATTTGYTEIGKATTQYATTTSLGAATFTAAGTLVTTDTEGSGVDEATTFGPGEWMVVKTGISDVTSWIPTGGCMAHWIEIQ